MAVKPVPDGFHTVTPYLMVEDAPKLMAFMKEAFDATETHCTYMPDGSVMHAQMRIGDSMIMISDAKDDWKAMPTGIYLYVENAEELYARAIKAGATSVMEVSDQFYGDRMGGVMDACGNYWWISTHVEDLTPEEFEQRHKAEMERREMKK